MFLRFRFVLLAIILPCVFVSCGKDEEDPYDVLVDFQNAVIPDWKFNNDAGAAGFFQEGIVSFQNSYEFYEEYGFSYWYGFAYSQMHDVETPGIVEGILENEFSAYVLNDLPENKFMVGYFAPWEGLSIDITFSNPVKDLSFDVANTTWAALAMKTGDGITKEFTGSDDWFILTIKVISTDEIETVSVKMGEGNKIIDKWDKVQVQSKNITKLEFSLDSNDEFLPTYFCIDNIKARTVK